MGGGRRLGALVEDVALVFFFFFRKREGKRKVKGFIDDPGELGAGEAKRKARRGVMFSL